MSSPFLPWVLLTLYSIRLGVLRRVVADRGRVVSWRRHAVVGQRHHGAGSRVGSGTTARGALTLSFRPVLDPIVVTSYRQLVIHHLLKQRIVGIEPWLGTAELLDRRIRSAT
jgi:hypothetical protein